MVYLTKLKLQHVSSKSNFLRKCIGKELAAHGQEQSWADTQSCFPPAPGYEGDTSYSLLVHLYY